MSGPLANRVAIVTGAGRGLGRSHALTMASLGAAVVVNDLGCSLSGNVEQTNPATDVVKEIHQRGGEAVISAHDVSNWSQAGELVEFAIREFGDLHVLVNNAGILRDRTHANMSEAEWDDVIRVHLKGHSAPSHHAANWWREQSRNGRVLKPSIIHTTSIAGLYPNFGQSNYCAAKAAIIALSQVLALEGSRIGLRSNAVAPSANTRMFAQPDAVDAVNDAMDPSHVSRLVAWLACEQCESSSQIYHVLGKQITVFKGYEAALRFDAESKLSFSKFARLMSGNDVSTTNAQWFMENYFDLRQYSGN